MVVKSYLMYFSYFLTDLNVEHAQLLLFLFHSLQLMQKKSVLLSVAAAVVAVAPVINTPLKDTQILHLARLLLVFDYLMKNLYEAPQILIEQVCVYVEGIIGYPDVK